MGFVKTGFAAFAVLALVSCTGTTNVSSSVPEGPEAERLAAESSGWRVADVRVDVPQSLSVSESNLYYPSADIVWRGESFGDRYAQVAQIMDQGLTRGLSQLRGSRRVVFDVEVHRFHSLTEKARVATGGVHNIEYTLTVRDARGGAVLYGPAFNEIALKAYGGEKALAAERAGQTQKVRILNHLTAIMRQTFPGGS